MKNGFVVVLVIIAAIAISLLFTAGLVYGACWAFGFSFSWKVAFGIWLISILVRSVVKNSGGK